MEVGESGESHEFAAGSCYLLMGLGLRGVLRAVGLCGEGQGLGALGLPVELKVAESVPSPLPSDSHK